MENKTGMICSECGKTNPEGASFCAWCGKELKKTDEAVCPACGIPYAEGMIFCPACGKKLVQELDPEEEPLVGTEGIPGISQTDPADTQEQAEPRLARRLYQKHEKRILLVRDAALVVLCALLCLFAFLPVFQWDKDAFFDRMYEMCEDASEREEVRKAELSVRKLDIDFTVVDYIRLAVRSFRNTEIQDLEDSAEYQELKELNEDLTEMIGKEIGNAEDDDPVYLSRASVDLIRKIVDQTLTLGYSTDALSGSARITVRVAAVIGILYLLLSVVLLILSVLNLIGRWINLRSLIRPTMTLLAVMPLLIAGLLYAVGLAMDAAVFGSGIPDVSVGLIGAHAGSIVFGAEGTVVAGIVLSAVAVVAAFSFSLIGKDKHECLRTIFRAVTAVLAAATVIGVCHLPILTEQASVVPKNRENTTTITFETDAGLYSDLFLSESEQEQLAQAVDQTKVDKKEQFAWYLGKYGFGRYTKTELNDGYADRLNDRFLLSGLLIGGQYEQGVSHLRFAYFLPFILIAFAAILLAAVTSVQLGGHGRGVAILSKVMMFLMSVGLLACSIILVCVTKITFDHYLVTDYTVFVGAAPIFLCVFSMLLLFIPVKTVQTRE